MKELEKIKQIAEQMPDSPEKQKALQAYSNLKTLEVVADSVEKTDLLKVLDMSEDEQWKWLEKKYGGGAFHSFETLAFMLRDEVCKDNHADFHEAIYDVMKKVEGHDNWATAFWGECKAKPIHWIIAALIAKESK